MLALETGRLHVLKCDLPYYRLVESGHKTAELRINDRHFEVGDRIELRETVDGEWTAMHRSMHLLITHVLRSTDGPWLRKGYVMLSFSKLEGD